MDIYHMYQTSDQNKPHGTCFQIGMLFQVLVYCRVTPAPAKPVYITYIVTHLQYMFIMHFLVLTYSYPRLTSPVCPSVC